MSENLSSLDIQRAAELANLANQSYEDNGGSPKNGWEKVITSEEVSGIVKGDGGSGYYGVVYRKADGTFDANGNSNYEYSLIHRGTDDWEDVKADIKTGVNILPEAQFRDANMLLKAAEIIDSKFSEAVSHGDVANVGHSLGGLLAKLFGAAMGAEEIVAYNSPGGKHLLDNAAEYWDQINQNPVGKTSLENKDYTSIVKEINAWGDPVSKIGGFGIGVEYDLEQGQSFLGSLFLDNPIVETVATVIGAKNFHSMDNLESSLNGITQQLIDDAQTRNAPTNSDGTVNTSLITNTFLDLSIRTDLKSDFLSNNNISQTGNVISGGDYDITAPIINLNGDGLKNVAPYSIVSDGYRPGNNELSQYYNLNTELKADFSKLDNLVNQINQQQNYQQNNQQQNPALPDVSKLNLQLQNPLANLTNNAINARTFVNIDPVVLDLNGDGVKLTSYNDSEVTFDVDNDGMQERTGWVSSQDGILVDDVNHNGKIDDITETISEYYNTNDGSVADADGKYFTDGLAALRKLDSNHDGKFNSNDAKWSDLRVWVDANGAVDFTTNPIGYEFNDGNLGNFLELIRRKVSVFLLIITAFFYAQSASADAVFRFTKITCIPELNYFDASVININGGSDEEVNFMSDDQDTLKAKYQLVGEKIGDVQECKLKNSNIKLQIKYRPATGSGECAMYNDATLKLWINKKLIVDLSKFDSCTTGINNGIVHVGFKDFQKTGGSVLYFNDLESNENSSDNKCTVWLSSNLSNVDKNYCNKSEKNKNLPIKDEYVTKSLTNKK